MKTEVDPQPGKSFNPEEERAVVVGSGDDEDMAVAQDDEAMDGEIMDGEEDPDQIRINKLQ
jgi:hypothetical protein